MEKRAIQEKTLRKLMAMKPAKWGSSHTEEKNLVKGLPSHLRGSKIVEKAIKELYALEFLTKLKCQNSTILKKGGLLCKPQINKWNSEHAQKPPNNKVAYKTCHPASAWWFLTKTGEWHVSLNVRKKEEIYRFLRIPPRQDERKF